MKREHGSPSTADFPLALHARRATDLGHNPGVLGYSRMVYQRAVWDGFVFTRSAMLFGQLTGHSRMQGIAGPTR